MSKDKQDKAAKRRAKEIEEDPWNIVVDEFNVEVLNRGNLIKIGKEQAQEQMIIALRRMGWEMDQFRELDEELAGIQQHFSKIDNEDYESGQPLGTGMVMFDRLLKQEIGEELFEPWKTRYTMQIPAWGIRCLHVHETASLMRTLQKGAKGAMKDVAWERGRELQEAGRKREEEFLRKKESTPRLCPFCGGQPEIATKTRHRVVALSWKSKMPKYARNGEEITIQGLKGGAGWTKQKFRYEYDDIACRCSNSKCPGHHIKMSHTEKEAIAIWNRRDD